MSRSSHSVMDEQPIDGYVRCPHCGNLFCEEMIKGHIKRMHTTTRLPEVGQ